MSWQSTSLRPRPLATWSTPARLGELVTGRTFSLHSSVTGDRWDTSYWRLENLPFPQGKSRSLAVVLNVQCVRTTYKDTRLCLEATNACRCLLGVRWDQI